MKNSPKSCEINFSIKINELHSNIVTQPLKTISVALFVDNRTWKNLKWPHTIWQLSSILPRQLLTQPQRLNDLINRYSWRKINLVCQNQHWKILELLLRCDWLQTLIRLVKPRPVSYVYQEHNCIRTCSILFPNLSCNLVTT